MIQCLVCLGIGLALASAAIGGLLLVSLLAVPW